MSIALGAAGVTVAFTLGIVGLPVVNACAPAGRDFINCIRDLANERFDLPGRETPPPRPVEPSLRAAEAPVPPALGPQPATPPMLAEVEAEPPETGILTPAREDPSAPEPRLHQAAVPPLANVPDAAPAVLPTVPDAPPSPEPTAELETAYAEPVRPEPPRPVAAPIALAPTIDAIELDADSSIISGSAPAGSLVRLFADGKLLGESQVENGRWLVQTGPILTQPHRELKIEAIEPETGKRLGEAAITVEIQLPDAPPATQQPPAPDQPSGPEQPAPPVVTPNVAPPSEDDLIDPTDEAPPTLAEPEPDNSEGPSSAPSADEPAPAPTADPTPDPTPATEAPARPPSPGVDNRTPTPSEAVGQYASLSDVPEPASSPAMLPDAQPVPVTPPPPDGPAIRAVFHLPAPKPPGKPVAVIQLFPSGDPVYSRFSGGKAIVRRGDTLWSLGHRYYGAGKHYRTIFNANREILRSASRIYPGQVLVLPIVTD
ncbi:LysM peptidoglycan-binding domain-containing protein [Devosia sp. ZB163]|uniref:LysM peptidoglycan-binding domain-containing protein n=1 Tax=Devosia sp. ZB163 TaxID=3025938 RepID=UPI002362F2FA|nr:LysM peptidoglycan-binding domain-containing protein [Devosia sp. ZB163]MDC9823916.1 LysM peptidoglycan-binding domain-containing protein [Devosia sp. ZB163]